MEARYALRNGELRLPMIALMWLMAGAAVYSLTQDAGGYTWFQPLLLQVHLAAFPLQQISAAFPTFAQTVALALVCVWVAGCSKEGAAGVCGGWMVLEIAYQYAQRSDVSSWIIPMLPPFFRIWPLSLSTQYLGRGTFSTDNVVAAIFGGLVAYLVVVNSHMRRRPRA